MKCFSTIKLVAEIWSSMDEPGGYHISLMWNLKKMKQINIVKQKETHKYERQIDIYQREWKRCRMQIADWEVQTTMCKMDRLQGGTVQRREI